MDQSKTLRDELIGTHTVNVNNEKDYRDNIQNMLDKKLSQTGRIIYALICIASAMVTLYFGKWVFTKNYGSDLAFIMQLICGAGMVFSCVLAFFSGWTVITGKVKGRFYPGFIFSSAVIVLLYFWIALFYMMYILPIVIESSKEGAMDYRSIFGIQLMLLGFFAMVTFGFLFVLRLLNDLKFKNHKKLLEIEYKLLEIAEKIDKSNAAEKRD